jgi:signal transduction histidine kinase
VVISKDYRIQWANKFIKEYKGNIEGKLCYATLNNLYQACPSCGVKKIFEHGANFDAHEYSSIDIKGNPHWSEIISTPIRDEAGNVVSAIEIAVDITEKKNLQRELSEYSQNLEKIVTERTEQLKQTQAKLVKSERLAAIGELAGMVGHDLRNPLAGMRSALYYLNKHCGMKLTSTELKMLHLIDDCVDHSDKIVNDLLDYSRELKLEVRETTVRELVSSSLKSLDVPITVQVIDSSRNDQIRVDIARMNRVFINLIKNAFEAMPEGGKLEINSKILSDEIEIEVRDTGVGMSTETLARIWTPLFTTKAKGMGFGLAICKRVIEAHAGKISVTSEVGKGTTFTIIIPQTTQ